MCLFFEADVGVMVVEARNIVGMRKLHNKIRKDCQSFDLGRGQSFQHFYPLHNSF